MRKILIAFILLIGITASSITGCTDAERLDEAVYFSDLYSYRIGSSTDEVESGYFNYLYIDGVVYRALPSQAGQSGNYLTTDGSVVSWATIMGGGDVASTDFNANTLLYAVLDDTPVATSRTAFIALLSGQATDASTFSWNMAHLGDVRSLRGCADHDLNISPNSSPADAVERDIIFWALDSVTDTWIETFRVSANGGNPVLQLTRDLDANGQDILLPGDVDGRDVSADGNKLDGIELLADVTDANNVDDAGATMNADFNAKGDLLTATGNDTPVILTIGADTFVLTADSGEASGMKWVAAGAGAGLSYTELDGTDQTTANAQGGADGEWVAWDLAGIIGSGSEVVEIRIHKLVATDSVGVRKNGSALAREFDALKGQSLILLVECNGSRVIQIQSDDVSDGDTFSVMGYWN